jgi:hypothetical protein
MFAKNKRTNLATYFTLFTQNESADQNINLNTNYHTKSLNTCIISLSSSKFPNKRLLNCSLILNGMNVCT